MSLKSSVFSTKRRNLIYAMVAVCLMSLVCIGVMASVESSTVDVNSGDLLVTATPPTAISSPSATAIPLSSPFAMPTAVPVPNPSPAGTPTALVRILAQYENAGTISVGTSDAAREAALTAVRTFLLRKWSLRQLGRLALVSTTPTGRPMTRNFYIERNTTGTWRITLEKEDSDPEEFYFVEEIGVTADGRPILSPSLGGPPAVSRALHLKHRAAVKNGIVL